MLYYNIFTIQINYMSTLVLYRFFERFKNKYINNMVFNLLYIKEKKMPHIDCHHFFFTIT